MTDDQAMTATPHADLIAELMNPNNPKNDREHAAVREIERLQKSLAQPEQEPVGRFAKFTDGIWREVTDGSAGVPLYTAPPQRPWVGLTPEEILDLFDVNNVYGSKWVEFARTVEAKLKERNT